MTEETSRPRAFYGGGYGRPSRLRAPPQPGEHVRRWSREEEILAGEAFQVVVSQRFETEISVDSLEVYRVMRRDEPEPVHVPAAARGRRGAAVRHRRVQPGGTGHRPGRAGHHAPIAGTRCAGPEEEDLLLEKDLGSDGKSAPST